MPPKSARKQKVANPFLITEDEIARHYNLLNQKKDIEMGLVHKALRPDLEKFLEKKGKMSQGRIKKLIAISYEDYKEWIIKIDKKGFDYPVLLSK
jgi:hypothetical protein